MSTVLDDRPPSRRRRRRGRRSRVLTALGLILILGGLGFLGYVAWQYIGTNIVAKQAQAQIRETIADDWSNGIDGDAVGLLRVERFGADYEVPINVGFGDEALSSGVGWYDDGAGPGQIGNFVVAGHRVTRGEPFRDFLELRAGDLVEVETRTHVYTYELRNDGDAITVDFTTGWPLFPVPDPNERGVEPTEELLTLLTCSEIFHTRDRNVVIGHLVDSVEKPATAAAPAS